MPGDILAGAERHDTAVADGQGFGGRRIEAHNLSVEQ
jgi:hypothetical protein